MSSAPSRALSLFLFLALSLRAGQEPPADQADRLGDLKLEELLNLRIERVFTASVSTCHVQEVFPRDGRNLRNQLSCGL